MAGTSLLALIDDIASVLDDVALMTKTAAKKTVGVLGDDLALNAEQVAGVNADRELPVVWAVAKGSMKNKLILVPSALLISAIASWAIVPLLMVGGAFLCFEGFEKLAHFFLHKPKDKVSKPPSKKKKIAIPPIDPLVYEKEKIKGAVRTDFILSSEIIVIALGTVKNALFVTQILVMAGVAVIMTVGVYSVVAGIVKLDDAGLYFLKSQGKRWWSRFKQWLGKRVLYIAPLLMKLLSVAGTAAMFTVGGGILVHGIWGKNETLHQIEESIDHLPVLGGIFGALSSILINMIAGVLAGGVVFAVFVLIKRLLGKFQKQKQKRNKKRLKTSKTRMRSN